MLFNGSPFDGYCQFWATSTGPRPCCARQPRPGLALFAERQLASRRDLYNELRKRTIVR